MKRSAIRERNFLHHRDPRIPACGLHPGYDNDVAIRGLTPPRRPEDTEEM